jgi:hypothetical protein
MHIPADPQVESATLPQESPATKPPQWARALTITLIVVGILALLASAAFTLAAIIAAMPLLLIGSFSCISVATAVTSVFYCRCCDVGPSWKIQREFTRLPPTSPLHQQPPVNYNERVI